jgi:hypothetical protein
MTQIDVTLTDYCLTLECMSFGSILALGRKHAFFCASWSIFFFSVALAALAGGTVHGFFLGESSAGYRILWPSTLIAIGVTALAGIRIASKLVFPASLAGRISTLSYVLFVGYCLVVLFVRRDFLVAVVGYLPSLPFLGWSFIRTYRRFGRPAYLVGVFGICTMLVAAAAQQAKLGVDPKYFNHNAVYHVLQAVGLYMLFVAARESTSSKEPIPCTIR